MMRYVFFLPCLLLVSSALGQTRLFTAGAEAIVYEKDSIFDIEARHPSGDFFDALNGDFLQLEALFMTAVSRTAKRNEMRGSRHLMELADLATSAWKTSVYADQKRWNKLNIHFQRSSFKGDAPFNLVQAISFRIPLVNDEREEFHFNPNEGTAEHGLYRGKKPVKREGEEEVNEIPLSYYTEQQLSDLFDKQLKTRGVRSALRSGVYSFVGVSVEVDERTLLSSRIPTARVVVILGAQRLRNLSN